MRFRRITYPGKTLVVDTLDARYRVFTAYFLQFWITRFNSTPDVFSPSTSGLVSAGEEKMQHVHLPGGFFSAWLFLLRARYTTVVFLNPDSKADRSLKWAARLAFIRNRAGFAPLRSFLPLNFSLPYNGENHHFIHQLKLFFEHLTGEKLAQWAKPEIPAANVTAHRGYGVVALDVADAGLEHQLPQFIRFINLVARDAECVVITRSSTGHGGSQDLARAVSAAMTEKAIENAHPLINPPAEKLTTTLANAAWVTGVDAGILNLAALMDVPTLAVFGPLNERVWQPFAPRARVITGEFACRPCTAYPGAVTCTADIAWKCVKGVSAELMLATLAGMLRRKPPVRGKSD